MATEPLIILVDSKGTRVVRRRIEAIGTSAKTSKTSVDFLKRSLVFLGAGLILRGTLRTLANFEQAMSTVKAVTGATEEQFVTLTDRARELGATTRFTATQAAEGLVFLARAGFEVDEALTAVGDTLLLAQAGALDLGSASLIVASNLRAFRLEADQAGRVSDVLAKAATSASTTVAELGDATKLVAPIATGLGVSLEETTAVLGVLSDNALRATLAGTGLRRILSDLESPAGAAAKVFKALGVEAEQVRVSEVGLTKALQVLADAGIDAGQGLEAFGLRGGPAFEVLRSSIPAVIELTEELRNAEGTAKSIADVMDDNLNGALLKVKSAFEAVILSFGKTTTTGIQSFLLSLTKSLRFLADNIEIVNGLLIGLAVVIIPKAVLALRTLAVAIAGTGIGAIAVVLGTVIGLLVAFDDKITLGSGSLVTLGDLGKATFEFLGDAVRGFFIIFEENFGLVNDLLKDIFPEFQLSIVGVLKVLAQLLDGVIGLIEGVVNGVIALFDKGLGPALKLIFIGILNGIILAFETQFNVITLGVEKLINVLARALNNLPGVNIPEVDIPDIKLPRIELSEEAADLGMLIADSVKEGILRTDVQDALGTILDRAEQFKDERLAKIGEELAITLDEEKRQAQIDALSPEAQELVKLAPTLNELAQQIDLLRLTSRERENQNKILAIENELKIKLSDSARALVISALDEARTVELVSDALADVRGEEIDLAAVQEELNMRLVDGSITAEEFEKALRSLELQAIETDKSLGAGLKRGLESIREEVTDVAGAMEDLLVNAFKSAEDALVEFVQTGTVDFSKFVDSLLEDLTRLIIKQTLLNLVSGTAGGAAGGLLGLGALGAAGAFAGGAFQAGGFAKAGEPILVGERGPEIFQPTQGGRVIPNAALPSEPPQVNLTVVNVTDPNDAIAAINTPDGEQAIVNVIRRQRRGVQQILS